MGSGKCGLGSGKLGSIWSAKSDRAQKRRGRVAARVREVNEISV